MELSKEIKRNIGVVTAITLGALGLTACASEANFDRERPVTVTSHKYDDPDHWLMPLRVGKITTMVPQYDPAHYYLDVQQCGFEPKQNGSNGEGCLTDTIEVDETFYSQTPDNSEIMLAQK